MLHRLRVRLNALLRRTRRFERREVQEARHWLEHTRNLIHLSILLFVPLLVGVVTFIFNREDVLPFLLFPPLASGTYALFAEPESRYASPRRFVGGMTIGALCGWAALRLTTIYWYTTTAEGFTAHTGAVAFGVLLTGLITWALDMEVPMAFSTALLVLVVGTSEFMYVVSVAVSSTLVAAVFVGWRRYFYEQREEYFYQSTKSDDRVLVPMHGEHADATAMLGARLAAAHDAGKVVLLDVVPDAATAKTEREACDADVAADGGENDLTDSTELRSQRVDERPAAEENSPTDTAARLEKRADQIEAEVGVPCQVVVAIEEGAPATTLLRTARETNCDLIVAPYDERNGKVSPVIRQLFGNVEADVLIHRSINGRSTWRRVLVSARSAGEIAHAMVDFACRLAGSAGRVSVCRCIDSERERRQAEHTLAGLVETVSNRIETRVDHASIDDFLAETAPRYDLVVVGASTDRSAASRFVSPPTFERITDIDCDVAIVDR